MDAATSRIIEAEPISSLWNIVDNRVVTWCNRQVDWMCWWVTVAPELVAPVVAYTTGYDIRTVTAIQSAAINVAQKAISTALFAFKNYASVHRVASTFLADEIKVLAHKLDEATSSEKYQLADLLYRRALQYDCGEEVFISLPGHYEEDADFLMRFSRAYLDSDISSAVLLAAMYGTDKWCHHPELAIKYDIEAARALYKEVMDSEDPLLPASLKADAIYKYAFLFVHGSLICNEKPIADDLSEVVATCKGKFDDLEDKGKYQIQMNRLSRVADLTSLVHVSRHHPRRALECMEGFGVTIHRLRDICKACSKNMGIRDTVTQF